MNQFSQDGYVYNMDGSMAMQGTAGMMAGDPTQMAVQQQQQMQQQQQQFMQQQQQQYGNVGNMATMQPQFWTGSTPEQGMNPQAPIFVANQNQPGAGGGGVAGGNNQGMRMPAMGQAAEEPMRIMFPDSL